MRQLAFTLIESLISLSLTLILIVGFSQLYLHCQRQSLQEYLQLQRNGLLLFSTLREVVHNAGYNGCRSHDRNTASLTIKQIDDSSIPVLIARHGIADSDILEIHTLVPITPNHLPTSAILSISDCNHQAFFTLNKTSLDEIKHQFASYAEIGQWVTDWYYIARYTLHSNSLGLYHLRKGLAPELLINDVARLKFKHKMKKLILNATLHSKHVVSPYIHWLGTLELKNSVFKIS